ncbi:MAG: glycosyltransferase family 9 protein [Caulobacterales bacterium]
MAAKTFPILFITESRLGAAVLSSGLLKKLHDEVPQAEFTVVGGPVTAELFADVPRLQKLEVVKRRSPSGRWGGFFGGIRARRWSLVVDMPARQIAGSLRSKKKPIQHSSADPVHKVIEAARLMRLADDEAPDPYLFTSDETEARAKALTAGGGPILAMAPAAEWTGKTWPAERFSEVARRLLGTSGPLAGGRLMVLGGPLDAHACETVRATVPRDLCIDLVGKDEILLKYAALKRATLFIGNDTGLMHLAATAGAPTLGLFGPSDDKVWGPWGPKARALRGTRSLEEIRRVDPSLSSAVCHMLDLSVESALSAAEAMVEEYAPHG